MYTQSPCRLFAYIYINNAQQNVSRDRLMSFQLDITVSTRTVPSVGEERNQKIFDCKLSFHKAVKHLGKTQFTCTFSCIYGTGNKKKQKMLFLTIYLLEYICQSQQQIKSLEDDSAKNNFSLSAVVFNFHFSNSTTFSIVHLCCMEKLLKAFT